MLVIFIIAPWLAFVVSLAFLFLYRLARFPLIGGTSAAWALYGAYEYLMYFRILCSGECNIRLDLLLIYPALMLLSVIAVIRFARRNDEPGAKSPRLG